jgi:CHAT domain-containing protein
MVLTLIGPASQEGASMMLVLLAVALAVVRPPGPGDDPRVIIRSGLRAVEGDSVATLRARWEARLRRDSTDRGAALGLATLARLTYDYPTADRFYRTLLAAARPDRYTPFAQLGLAWGRDAQGFSNSADSGFVRARAGARDVGDRTAEGEALLGLAFGRARAEGMRVGLALLDTAARLIPDSTLDLQAERHRRRAIILATLGRPEAIAEVDSTVSVARRAGVLRTEADGLRGLARAMQVRGQVDSEMTVLRRAEQLYVRAHDRSTLATALIRRAEALLARAELGEAKALLHLARREGEASHNLWAVAMTSTQLGKLDIQLNDFVAAADHLNAAAAMFEKLGHPGSVMVNREELAWVALAAGDVARARQQTLELLDFYRRTDQPSEQLAELQFLAFIAVRERDWASADRALADARALARRSSMPQWDGDLAYDDGQLALFRGDLTAAERSYTRYLHGLDSAEHARRYDTRLRLAEVYARRGELPRAAREATSAWDELDHWRASLNDRELRLLAFQASIFDIDQWDASVARVLSALAAGGHASTAFELAERRRARELSDRLTRGAALVATAAPAAARGARETQPVTSSTIAAAIPNDHTAVLEYVVGARDAPTTLLVVTRAGVQARLLTPIDSLAERIDRFVSLTESGADARLLSRALGAALFDSAVTALPQAINSIVVIPDGRLYRVPFDALRMTDNRYVVERFAVTVAPSAAVVATLWQRARERNSTPVERPMRLLAFGDPAFAHRDVAGIAAPQEAAAETYHSAFDSAGGLQRLKASGGEARLVARFASEAEVRLGEQASAAYLKRAALEHIRVIHFATHALVDERTAARTALALAPGDGESGFVGPGDLAGLKLDADLIVLSACRTAGGVVLGGEGIQGLTAPLLQAGARSVVATQWRIGDRSTVAFVEGFYRGLARALPVAEALRAAKLEAIRGGAPPSEWAAFTVVGDPFVIVPLRVPARARGWWLAALAALAFGAGRAGIYSRRRTRHQSAG